MIASWLSSVLLVVHRTLTNRGLDADAITRSAGLEPAQLTDADARIPASQAAALWEAAVDAVDGDPCFGLDVAQALHPTSLHAVGYAWMASGTLREAGQRLIRYFRVINSVDQMSIRHEEGLTWVVFGIAGDYVLPRSYDTRLATLMRMCRAIRGEDFVPAKVRLLHERPPERCAQRMIAFYRITPEWSAQECAFAVPSAILDEELPIGNATLALASEKIAADYLARHMRNDVSARVRRCLIELLPGGEFARQDVARRLALGERTMQRRLADAGTSYAELLDTLRRDLALDYLRSSTHSVHEVAYLLGFAEIASFSRAFRRWTGQPPSQWRERATLTAA